MWIVSFWLFPLISACMWLGMFPGSWMDGLIDMLWDSGLTRDSYANRHAGRVDL